MIDGDVVFYSTCVIGIMCIILSPWLLQCTVLAAAAHTVYTELTTRRRCSVQIFVFITAQLHQFFIIIVQMWLYRFAFVDPHAVCIREVLSLRLWQRRISVLANITRWSKTTLRSVFDNCHVIVFVCYVRDWLIYTVDATALHCWMISPSCNLGRISLAWALSTGNNSADLTISTAH